MKTRVIAWWSGGVASAVACKWALSTFKDVEVVFIDIFNESDDTYRFLADCEKVYGVRIKVISNPAYNSIQDVWRKFNSLNTATGAICSTELKRAVRESYQDLSIHYGQVFGFDKTELKRHLNMLKNYPEINAISPLVVCGVGKEECIEEVLSWGIDVPEEYRKGYRNNNCAKTGCVQGGIGYWQKKQRTEPEVFDVMADMEHELTDAAGHPVTICKDQAKGHEGELVFLKPHPDYPNVKDISMKKGREPEPLMECIGFCRTVEN